ncbi:DegT/DnrJ/EryC1/StrS family aminotransferase [Streptomyces gossypii]|uniref:DegT/DnrJ/EryC1/StrS family aminotransferase n=1 Tax=Streptomyces gossypii TaxID=2883101 RepID=UPI00288301B1|nr:DegT/DnrJ/EryC1/StrS family aminotransferase [Streptomyces gossypii]
MNEPASVPFFSQAASFEEQWPEIFRHVSEVFDSGQFSNGGKVAEFEDAMCAYTGARHAIGVSNATDALTLLLRGSGIGPGDDVVVPAFTFVASGTSVVLAGARPVFADIDPVSYALDPDSFERAITPATRAVMPVHLFSQMADMDALGKIADRHGITVLEDSAEAIGMRWNGVHAGLLGAGGVLSFFPAKTLGALGDGGMLLTDDDELAERLRALRNHGRSGTPGTETGRDPLTVGGNSKMDDIQASVLLAKLAGLDGDIARRAELAERFTEGLTGVPGILALPTIVRADSSNPVYYVYLIEVERRDELVAYLAARGIGTETYYPTPLHLQPCFASLGHRPGDFPVAEAASARTLGLPFYPDLVPSAVDRTCAAIREFLEGDR